MNPLSATIVVGNGADDILFEIDKPNGCDPYTGNASVSMKVAQGTGEEYLKVNFPGLPYEVIRRTRAVWEKVPRI